MTGTSLHPVASAAAVLSADEARQLTDDVKAEVERLWRKLLELYEGKAHVALGYASWHMYYTAEFGGSKSRAYQILDAGRVAQVLESTPGGLAAIPTEKHARVLAPIVKQPEIVKKVVARVIETTSQPTAAQVKAELDRVVDVTPKPRKEWIARNRKETLHTSIGSLQGSAERLRHFRTEKPETIVDALGVATDEEVAYWVESLTEASREINAFKKHLKAQWESLALEGFLAENPRVRSLLGPD
jgi:hypothetical protein